MKHKNIKLILNYVIGPIVFCILMYSIYHQIQAQEAKGFSFSNLYEVISTKGIGSILILFFLMLLNWGIEAKKWQLSIKPLVNIHFWTSYKAIFSGSTVAFFTPNRMGEYLGRMLYVNQAQRLHSIPLTILGSITQLTITIFGGLFAFIYWIFIAKTQPFEEGLLSILLGLSIVLCVLWILFFCKTKWLLQKILSVKWMKKFEPYFVAVQSIDQKTLYKLIGWSLARYFVFILQYWLMMNLFGIDLPFILVIAVMSTIFFLLAIIPTFGELMDMGIRLQAGVYIMHQLTGNATGMLATSLTIWIVNLVIPALIGSLLILTIRIFNNKNQEVH